MLRSTAITKELAVIERKLRETTNETLKNALKKKQARLKDELKDASKSAPQLAKTLLAQREEIKALPKSDFNDLIRRLSKKPEYSFLKTMGKSTIRTDIERPAKPVGWRFKGRGNYETPTKAQIAKGKRSGTVYREVRPLRSDVSRIVRLEDGGVVGQEIVIDYQGDEYKGVIVQITDDGDYIVDTDNGRTVLAQKEMDVISLGAMKKKSMPTEHKKRFGFFKDGGKLTDAQQTKFDKVMREWKQGTLNSGSENGPIVTDQDQAIAIAYAEARGMKKMAFGGLIDENNVSTGGILRMEELSPNETLDEFINNAKYIVSSLEDEGFEKDEIYTFLAHMMVQNTDSIEMIMETGGGVDGMSTVNEIARLSGLRSIAVAEWADKNNVNLTMVLKDLKSKKIKGADLMTAIVGKPSNKYSTEMISQYGK